jgi:hypothetical protein
MGEQESHIQPTSRFDQVPEEMLARLHAATGRFHSARTALEETRSNAAYRHVDRIQEQEDAWRLAEKEMEMVNKEIEEFLAAANAVK